MTIAGALWPRSATGLRERTSRVFRVDRRTRVLTHCDGWTENPRGPVLVLVHGLVGSSASPYAVGTASKAVAAGFRAVRVNVRNCGDTEHLTSEAYHGGVTDDVAAVVRELAERDGCEAIHVAGYSIGGNIVLKLAGERRDPPLAGLRSVACVSPCIDFAAAAEALDARVTNTLYRVRFLRDLKRMAARRMALDDVRLDTARVRAARTLREFDDAFTAPRAGFDGVEDYYARASALRVLQHIDVPTLVITARDDPLVPVASVDRPELRNNPRVGLRVTATGGHVAFIGRRPGPGARGARDADGDRFWAENRLVRFAAERS